MLNATIGKGTYYQSLKGTSPSKPASGEKELFYLTAIN
jgi:hypothetical protein